MTVATAAAPDSVEPAGSPETGDHASDDESHEPTTPEFEALWDDPDTGPVQVPPGQSSRPTALHETEMVDAPGWPTPGELLGVFELENFDPLPPEVDDPRMATLEDAAADVEPENANLWDDLEETPGKSDPVAPRATWERGFGASRDGAAVTTIAPLAPAEPPAWEPDRTVVEAADVVEQPSWTSADWPVEAELPSTWADPDPRDDNLVRWSDEVDAAGAETAGNDDARILEPWEHAGHLLDSPQQPTPVAPRSAVEAAVAPLLRAASAGGAPAPVVVVITPEMLTAAPSRREAELERAVRRLERKIATLTATASDPRPQRPSRPKPGSTSATSRSTSHTTAPLPLTAAEQRALRALAAKRSAPIAARRRARIILRAARGLSTATIATQVGVSQSTVRRWRARFATDRLAALGDDLRTPATRARNTSRR